MLICQKCCVSTWWRRFMDYWIGYDKWIQAVTGLTIDEFVTTVPEADASLFRDVSNVLRDADEFSFLDKPQHEGEHNDILAGPRFLCLAFPDIPKDAKNVTNDLIGTDIDKTLWLRIARAKFKGSKLEAHAEPDHSGLRLDLVSILMGAFNANKPESLQINICAYSGHGISEEYAEMLNNNPDEVRRIYETQQRNGVAEVNQLGYQTDSRGNPGSVRFHCGDGVLRPYKLSGVTIYFGIKDISAYWLANVSSHPNKYLVVVLDSCFSGNAPNVFADIPQTKLNPSSGVIIQYACDSKGSAYAGYFTPTFLRLQHAATRHTMGSLYKAVQSPLDLPGLPKAPRQNVGLFVSNADNNGDPPGFVNESNLHNDLFFEHPAWPIVLIKDSQFFGFCYHVFTKTNLKP